MQTLPLKLTLLALALSSGQETLLAYTSKVKLTGRSDQVLSIATRKTVLEVGQSLLSRESDDYLSAVEALKEPFAFEKPIVAEPLVDSEEPDTPPEPTVVHYDDSTVLDISAVNFAKKVTGSIARGDATYLQLEGGTLLKPGASFPVHLPIAPDQSFTLTITEITPNGYTLKIGTATKTLTYDESNSSTGSVQFMTP